MISNIIKKIKNLDNKAKLYLTLGATIGCICIASVVDFGNSAGLGDTLDNFESTYGKPIMINEISSSTGAITKFQARVYQVNNGSKPYKIGAYVDSNTKAVYVIMTSGTKDTIEKYIPNDAELCVVDGKSYDESYMGTSDFYSSKTLREKYNKIYGKTAYNKIDGEKDFEFLTLKGDRPEFDGVKYIIKWTRPFNSEKK